MSNVLTLCLVCNVFFVKTTHFHPDFFTWIPFPHAKQRVSERRTLSVAPFAHKLNFCTQMLQTRHWSRGHSFFSTYINITQRNLFPMCYFESVKTASSFCVKISSIRCHLAMQNEKLECGRKSALAHGQKGSKREHSYIQGRQSPVFRQVKKEALNISLSLSQHKNTFFYL